VITCVDLLLLLLLVVLMVLVVLVRMACVLRLTNRITHYDVRLASALSRVRSA
jgi:hypothetical protein